MRLANARLKIAANSVSRPPMPMSSNLKLGAKMALVGPLITSVVLAASPIDLPLRTVFELDSTTGVLHPDDLGAFHDDTHGIVLSIEIGDRSDHGLKLMSTVVKHDRLEGGKRQ